MHVIYPVYYIFILIISFLVSCQKNETSRSSKQNEISSTSLRIVSLAPSHTDWIYALDAQEYLVARTDLCDIPTHTKPVPSIGSLFPYNLEKILSYKANTALMISGHLELKNQLQRFGMTVHQLQPKTLQDIYEQTQQLGHILRRSQQAQEWVVQAQAAQNHLHQISKRPRALIEVWFSPLTIAGHQSYMGDILKSAGGELLMDTKGEWPVIHFETLLKFNPEALFISTKALYQKLVSDDPPVAWKGIEAVKSKKVFYLDGRLSRPGPKVIEEMIWLNQKLKEVSLESIR